MELKSQENFRRNSRRAMQLLSMSGPELGEIVGHGKQYVNTYLNGHRSPGLDVIEKFSEAFGCTPSQLIADEEIDLFIKVPAHF